MNTTPGSPVFHADSAISFQRSRARIVSTTSSDGPAPSSRGLIKCQSASSLTAFMNSSDICTDMLKFWSVSSLSLQWMKSLTSGCESLSWPMCAPSLKAPCVSVAPTDEYSFITAIGPQA